VSHGVYALLASSLPCQLWANMMSSTKMVHIVLHCYQRTESWPQVTCTEKFVKFGHFYVREWTDIQTCSSQYFTQIMLFSFCTLEQGCSLSLDVSVSRRIFQTSRSHLGLVERWEGLGLDLISDWKSNVLVSYHRASFTSLQNCTYIVLNARRLYCLLIHKFTYLL